MRRVANASEGRNPALSGRGRPRTKRVGAVPECFEVLADAALVQAEVDRVTISDDPSRQSEVVGVAEGQRDEESVAVRAQQLNPKQARAHRLETRLVRVGLHSWFT